MKKKKLLFIYLRTGGGHLAPARAIAEYINKYKSENAETFLIDGFSKSKWFAKFIIEDGYRHLQSKAKWFYEFLYLTHKIKFISHISAFLVSINITKYLKEVVKNYQPDKIVIFHFFLIKPVYATLKKMKLKTPVITVVTDPFTAHPLWFLKKDQNFIVFSDELKKYCIKNGIDESQLHVFPFVLSEKFSNKADDSTVQALKKMYGVEYNNVLLILGGGDGIPNGKKILMSLYKNKGDYSVIIVCGKNKKLFNSAIKMKEEFGWNQLSVYGFVDFVNDIISMADLVITKCGASTFMEILISGKIPIINSYIWEQEKGNMDFIVNNKLGIYQKNVKKLPSVVNNLFGNKDAITQYKRNIENIGLINGSDKVAEFIITF